MRRVRYAVGFFASDDAPPLRAIQRSEQQLDVDLAPGETKPVTFVVADDGGATWRRDVYSSGRRPSCFGVRAVPFMLGDRELTAAEAWGLDGVR